MATLLGASSPINPPDILLGDIWAALVLQPFEAFIDVEKPHCPTPAASEGFSRNSASDIPQLYIEDAQLMFFPAGELLSKLVAINQGDPTYCTFFQDTLQAMLSKEESYKIIWDSGASMCTSYDKNDFTGPINKVSTISWLKCIIKGLKSQGQGCVLWAFHDTQG
jgi:hypothetical protein